MAGLAPLGSAEARAGMARYGISVQNAFGVSADELRRVAKGLGRDHDLALALWATGATRRACWPRSSTSRRR